MQTLLKNYGIERKLWVNINWLNHEKSSHESKDENIKDAKNKYS